MPLNVNAPRCQCSLSWCPPLSMPLVASVPCCRCLWLPIVLTADIPNVNTHRMSMSTFPVSPAVSAPGADVPRCACQPLPMPLAVSTPHCRCWPLSMLPTRLTATVPSVNAPEANVLPTAPINPPRPTSCIGDVDRVGAASYHYAPLSMTPAVNAPTMSPVVHPNRCQCPQLRVPQAANVGYCQCPPQHLLPVPLLSMVHQPMRCQCPRLHLIMP